MRPLVPAILLACTATAGQATCYLRVYDAAHLATHPEQTVRQMALGPAEGARRLRMALQLVNEGSILTGEARCDDASGDRVFCVMEPMRGGDGRFSVEPHASGGVLLRVLGDLYVSGGGDQEIAWLSETVGDDAAFVLPPVPADACP